MNEAALLVAVGMLVAFAAVKGYTTKVLGQLTFEYRNRLGEERRLKDERAQTEVLYESAVARRDQTRGDEQKFSLELQDLLTSISEIEAELNRSKPEHEDEAPE